MELKAGQIVTVDWRKEPDDPAQDPQPPEPNKLRPAVVVQCSELFDPAYPTCAAKPRITAATKSQITPTELQQLRQLVVLSIGGLS